MRRLEAEPDYEKKLDAARGWMKEWHFRIGVHHLRGLIDADEAGKSYADLAGATLQGLWPALCQQVTRRYGEMPGRGAVLLGMGSLGAGRLNAASDLDLRVRKHALYVAFNPCADGQKLVARLLADDAQEAVIQCDPHCCFPFLLTHLLLRS